MSNVPTDYKRTYTTYDNVAVDPTDEVWVPINSDIESHEYEPTPMTAKQAEDKGYRFYYSTQEACLDHCSDINEDDE